MAAGLKVEFRRKRESKTDYAKRITFIKSGIPRIVVRKTLKNIHAQLIEFNPDGDKVLVSASSKQLEKLGWKYSRSNLAASYLVGFMLGKNASKKGVKNAILDIGMNISTKGSKLYALLKGVVDSGIEVPYSEEILPSDERIKGKHIADFASSLKKDNKEKYDKVFSSYAKNNVAPEGIAKSIEEIKSKL